MSHKIGLDWNRLGKTATGRTRKRVMRTSSHRCGTCSLFSHKCVRDVTVSPHKCLECIKKRVDCTPALLKTCGPPPSSCARCRRLKVKCDKLVPCSHCSRANVECAGGTVANNIEGTVGSRGRAASESRRRLTHASGLIDPRRLNDNGNIMSHEN